MIWISFADVGLLGLLLDTAGGTNTASFGYVWSGINLHISSFSGSFGSGRFIEAVWEWDKLSLWTNTCLSTLAVVSTGTILEKDWSVGVASV